MNRHPGIPTPSEASDGHDGRTDWPADRFTQWVMGTVPASVPLSSPAAHSYAADDNMEAFDALPPYTVAGDEADLARYTGATGACD